jgi:hypothetical protein
LGEIDRAVCTERAPQRGQSTAALTQTLRKIRKEHLGTALAQGEATRLARIEEPARLLFPRRSNHAMNKLRALGKHMNLTDEEGGWNPEDIATLVLVGFLSAMTLIALV